MLTLKNNQIQEILNHKAVLENGINDILKMVLNALMYAERQAFLQGQKDHLKNKANGYRSIKINGYGRQLALAIPRDRLAMFKPLLLLALKEEAAEINRLCYELYISGCTTRKIKGIFERIYGKKYGQATISSMVQTFKEELAEWRSRSLDSRYPVVYLDAIHAKVRRGGKVEVEAFYVALAIKEDYTREVIALYNNPTESASGWEEVLKQIKKRGTQDIDIVVADGIAGLEDKVLAQYPKASFQKCVTHLKRNILHRVRPKEKAEMATDLKDIFDITNNGYTKQEAYKRAKAIASKWGKKYPSIKNMLGEANLRSYLTCLDFNLKTRSIIYTTNALERLNKEFRGALKIRNAMPTIDSVLLLLSAIACKMEKKTYSYPIDNFSCETTISENLYNSAN